MYPNYAWIVLGWFEDDWWTQGKNPSSIDCTDDQLGEFLHRTLAILVFAVASDEDAATDTQLVKTAIIFPDDSLCCSFGHTDGKAVQRLIQSTADEQLHPLTHRYSIL